MTKKKYRGIILAGGGGSRLYPITALYSKQLVNIYDKPMIYYPLTTVMMADVREILIIANEPALAFYRELFNDGHHLGLEISYAIQEQPRGIAEAFIIGDEFIGDENVVLALGDNLFYGYLDFLRDALVANVGATVFAYFVKDPYRYGVVEFDAQGKAISLEEKPERPKSNFAVPGLYICDANAPEIARTIKPSGRNELEITDVMRAYLEKDALSVRRLGRGVVWLDSGTPKSLLEAANFIATIEARQGLKIGCIEEVALRRGFIDVGQFKRLVQALPACQYRDYLDLALSDFLREGRDHGTGGAGER
jgi:glucose-1-phosphate thymidylyltransferase